MSKMKLLQVFIIFLVLWLEVVKSEDLECFSVGKDDCWDPETMEKTSCLGCIVKHVKISPNHNVFTILPRFENGSYAKITSVYFSEGTTTSFPVVETESKSGRILNINLFDTNTKVINANFFGDRALNLQEFKSENNSLTIEENSFENVTNLVVLDIVSGHIAEIPSKTFLGLKKLNQLIIRDSELTHIDPIWLTDLQNLRVLYFNQNSIQVLEHGIFDKLVHLSSLDVGRNRIETIPRDLFKYNVKMYSLNLEGNNIKKFENKVFAPLKELDILFMSGNQCVNKYYLNATAILSNVNKDLAECYSDCKFNC